MKIQIVSFNDSLNRELTLNKRFSADGRNVIPDFNELMNLSFVFSAVEHLLSLMLGGVVPSSQWNHVDQNPPLHATW